jgi:nucleoside-diphosphate-sugar epimerase
MKVFVTGASGWVGLAVVKDLVRAGHKVVGMVRSDAGAKTIAAAGAEVHRGDLNDLESLRSGAAASDGVIHTAFNHDFANYAENCELDRRAIETLGEALVGSNRPFVVTSGTALISPGRLTTEDMPAPSDSIFPRVSEKAAVPFAERGVRVMMLRLPPSVHGEGDHGFVPLLVNLAREKGAAAYVDDGANHWPGVHLFDAAALYRLALEKGTVGARYHAVADEGVSFRQLAEVIGRRSKLPVVSKTKEQAAEHFGWFAHFAALHAPSSSQVTRDLLGWKPKEIGLIADVDQPYYFKASAQATA